MLYHLLYPLTEYVSGMNIFRYITFRTAGATVTAIFICLIMGPFFIRLLKKYQVAETIRKEGPESHQKKAGTPTMGGLIVLAGIVVPTLLWADLTNYFIQMVLVVTVWLGVIGFMDDYLKVIKKHPHGLVARRKMIGQVLLGALFALGLMYLAPSGQYDGTTGIPFFKNYMLYLGIMYLPFVIVVITGASNAVNLTDGLDGLAIGLCGLCFAAFGGIVYLSGRLDYSSYLQIEYFHGAGELTIFCGAAIGAALGFLWFNSHPAEVFMGDTGSLSLGGALGAIAILVKKELLLVIVGGVFVITALSVILQVLSYRYPRWKKDFQDGTTAPSLRADRLAGIEDSCSVLDSWRSVCAVNSGNVESAMTVKELIHGRDIGIVGMARSGLAVARQAALIGGRPFVSDAAKEEALADACSVLRNHDIPYETGGHTDRLLQCDYLIVSPGVPLRIDILNQAREKGIPIFSELEFASWVCPAPIVAVTGSNGKTTTTTLIGEILKEAGIDAYTCGNIGFPFAEAIGKMKADSVAVVEVSSFQLETISEFRPDIAVILNLTPDHIDRHGSFEEYKKTKFRITENQTSRDALVLNHDDPETQAYNVNTKAERLSFTTTSDDSCTAFVKDDVLCLNTTSGVVDIIKCSEIGIKGPHNLQNAATATVITSRLNVESQVIAKVLREFKGVEHRLEAAGTVAGIAFVNDSKATNVDSVRYALRSVTPPIHLILGGRDKGGDFTLLAELGEGKVSSIVAIGEARDKIFESLGKQFSVQFADSLEEAIIKCFELAHPGETVLLSPGCASFDMFNDYEHRGRVFKEVVASLKNGKNSDERVPSQN